MPPSACSISNGENSNRSQEKQGPRKLPPSLVSLRLKRSDVGSGELRRPLLDQALIAACLLSWQEKAEVVLTNTASVVGA